MKITKRVCNNRNRYAGVNTCRYITIHQTGNTLKGADAIKHARLLENGWKSTWHYTVDDSNIVQHFEDTVQCWHAGDGRGRGNLESIGIELCVNQDGDYMATIRNAVELVAHLCSKYDISVAGVRQHYEWSKKDCPQQIRAGVEGVTWSRFRAMVNDKIKYDAIPDVPKQDESTYQLALDVIAGKYGNGATRRKMLGSRFQSVQERVNQIMKDRKKKK